MLRQLSLIALLSTHTQLLDTQTIFRDGFEASCLLDSDSDRLVDCEEAARNTLPSDPDTDADGLSDGDEVLGTLGGLDLPALGVNPRHKDLLVEMDWDEDARGCAAGLHSHRPQSLAMAEVALFYASVPVPNPDGVPGIHFIADFGQGPAPFTGGNLVDFPNAVVGKLGQAFKDVKAANFEGSRVGYFRYQVHAHYWKDNDNSSGVADIAGDDSAVTLNCVHANTDYVRNTVIHELGHNLGLFHGANEDCNRKPNYNSLMNYNHQFDGLDVDCDRHPDGASNLGYSFGDRTRLTNGAIDERLGVCPLGHPRHQPIDWNGNGVIDSSLVSYDGVLSSDCALSVASDFNDYGALIVHPFSSPGGGAPTPPQAGGACAPTPAP